MPRQWQYPFDEPLTVFAVIGGLLFVINGFRSERDTFKTIEVRPATIRALEQSQEDLIGRPLTETEREDVVAGFIDEEVLISEAYRMELERKDTRVRKRLIDVMRSTLDQPIASPTRAELEAYFREKRERFIAEEVVTFDHVFFSQGSEKEPEDLGSFLEDLRAGANHEGLGDYAMFSGSIRDRSEEELRRTFGSEFAKKAFAFPIKQWQGPLESRAGLHFLRVVEKRKPPPPDFDQMEEYLRQDWMFRRRRANQDEKIEELKSRYRIVFLDE